MKSLSLLLFLVFASPLFAQNKIVESLRDSIFDHLEARLSYEDKVDGERRAWSIRDEEFIYEAKQIDAEKIEVTGKIGMGHEYDGSVQYLQEFSLILVKKNSKWQLLALNNRPDLVHQTVINNQQKIFEYLSNVLKRPFGDLQYDIRPPKKIEFSVIEAGRDRVTISGEIAMGLSTDASISHYEKFEMSLILLKDEKAWVPEYSFQDYVAIITKNKLLIAEMLNQKLSFIDLKERVWTASAEGLTIKTFNLLPQSTQNVAVFDVFLSQELVSGKISNVLEEKLRLEIDQGRIKLVNLVRSCKQMF